MEKTKTYLLYKAFKIIRQRRASFSATSPSLRPRSSFGTFSSFCPRSWDWGDTSSRAASRPHPGASSQSSRPLACYLRSQNYIARSCSSRKGRSRISGTLENFALERLFLVLCSFNILYYFHCNFISIDKFFNLHFYIITIKFTFLIKVSKFISIYTDLLTSTAGYAYFAFNANAIDERFYKSKF